MTSNSNAAFDADQADFLLHPGHLLRRCNQILVGVFLEHLRPLDLTPLQLGLLVTVERLGPMDQIGLAGAIALDRNTTLVVLRNLEARGLVTRKRSALDKRSREAELTKAGRQLLKAALPKAEIAREIFLSPLSKNERMQLISLMDKIAEKNNELSRAPQRLPQQDDEGEPSAQSQHAAPKTRRANKQTPSLPRKRAPARRQA